jgi:CheY-like chemotaxis protein
MGKEKYTNGKKKILWVEDDYYHLKGLTRPLEKAGFEVIPARSVVEAKSLLGEWQSFQLIILDLIIPYSDTELATSDPEPHLNFKNGKLSENVSLLVRNGLILFDYIVSDLKVNIPILILSIVQTNHIIKDLLNRGAARSVKKEGLIPKDVQNMVLDIIQGNNQTLESGHLTDEG